MRGWDNVLAATLVELTPASVLGRLAWGFAPRLSRAPVITGLLRHLAAACTFAVIWTAVVGIAVILLQPAARANFFGRCRLARAGGDR
ncbi:hypothetical protein [Novosphingopyxis sp.]|uniref:hypothetical protein n=1 Tax=Novosphingopyxis sp. TaxID=2709690 RepID=UPI003B5C161D